MPNDQARLTDAARQFYNRKTPRSIVEDVADRNLLLSGNTGIVNHHFGLGDFDRAIPLGESPQDRIEDDLNRLEVAQIKELVSRMGEVPRGSRVLDAGSGRGGTALFLAREFGVRVDGVNVAQDQIAFADRSARNASLSESVAFHLMDYLALAFAPATFDHVITNETTMYACDLHDLFRSFAGVLKPGGRYTLATWCINEHFEGRSGDLCDAINRHYGTRMHTRQQYLQALASAGFGLLQYDDVTEAAIPYWELRSLWDRRSGIEPQYLAGHRQRSILYLLISAVYEG